MLANEPALAEYAHQGGDDLLARLTTTEDGEPLLANGVFVPVLGVHGWSYRVIRATHGLSAEDVALLGAEVLFTPGGRAPEYRLRGAGGELVVLSGRSLESWSRRRVMATMPWSDDLTRVRLRGFVNGPHGEGLVPTYVLEPVVETGASLAEPPINRDLGQCWEELALTPNGASRHQP